MRGDLLAGPDRVALFRKSRSAFLGISRGKYVCDARALQIEHVSRPPVARLSDDLFGGLDGKRPVCSDFPRQRQGRLECLAWLYQLIDEAILMEALRRKHIAREHSF